MIKILRYAIESPVILGLLSIIAITITISIVGLITMVIAHFKNKRTERQVDNL